MSRRSRILLSVAPWFFLCGAEASPGDSILWRQQNLGNQTLWAVTFSDSLHGWAGGNGGLLYRTVNGGADWTRLPSLGSDTIYALSFEDDTAGWAASGSGRIYRTLNGGVSWTQSYFRAGWISGLLFFGRDTGFACGAARRGLSAYDPVIYRTWNRGQTWDSVGIGSGPYSLKALRSPDRINLFVAGFNYFLRSRNLGASFPAPVYFPDVSDSAFRNSSGYVNTLDFSTPDRGFGVGRYGHIVRTDDTGASWRNVMPNTFVWYEDVRFADPARGIIAGERGAVRSTADSGNTWTLRYPRHQPTLNAPWFRALFVLDSANIWMAGDSGLIMKGAFAPPAVGIAGRAGRGSVPFLAVDPAAPGPWRIRYALPSAGRVELELFDAIGRGVTRMDLGRQPAGVREFAWDLHPVIPGIYFIQFRLNGEIILTQKIALLR
jgi:photosystem II stability/assembly factor-like uncharacterized protein